MSLTQWCAQPRIHCAAFTLSSFPAVYIIASEEICMREAESESKAATIILAALAALAVACFVFAGVAMFEQPTVTATSSLPVNPHVPG